MDQREEAGGHDGEDGHGLGGAGDGVAPVGAQQVEDGGDERAGVGDPDPEDEIGDVDGPADRAVQAGDPHAELDLVDPGRAPPSR